MFVPRDQEAHQVPSVSQHILCDGADGRISMKFEARKLLFEQRAQREH